MVKKVTTEAQRQTEELLKGVLIALDPATGESSNPGYAVFWGGEFQEKGIINLDKKQPIARRMARLLYVLQTRFPVPDCVLIEKIPNSLYIPGKGATQPKGWQYLHWCCGVMASAYDTADVLEVPPQSWKRNIKTRFPSYVKTDANDALAIGASILCRYCSDIDPDRFDSYFDFGDAEEDGGKVVQLRRIK